MAKNEILSLVEKVHNLKKGCDNQLPNNSYFLDENEILCYPDSDGDSRYPYYNDGLVLFAHSDGYVDCIESLFNIFKIAHYNEDTPVAFFAGEKRGENYFPISITGAARQLFEENIDRYVIFTPVCAYYIAETKGAVYAVKMYVNEEKHLRFTMGAVNRGEKREIYLCSYFEPNLRYQPYEGFFQRMTKYGEHFTEGGFVVKVRNSSTVYDCMASRVNIEGEATAKYFTTSKNSFIGNKGGNLTNAVSLKNGVYNDEIVKTNTTNIPVISNIIHFEPENNEAVFVDYEMMFTKDTEKAKEFASEKIDVKTQDILLEKRRKAEKTAFENMNISFTNWKSDKINANVAEKFLKCVQRQVSLCALSKNYAGEYLGIRDVFQQLESALLWNPTESRKQIVKIMNYILDDGRAPRQVSFPAWEGAIPKMDLRPFIDQGFWIIETIYSYLGFTGDFSILDEVCGYFRAVKTMGPLEHTEQRDSILCHLIRITDFLVSNLDDKTHCMHALYGDWNDALDGLGKTKDKTREYGDGVSIMATEQLYLALGRMCEILEAVSEEKSLTEKYNSIRKTVAEGFKTNAVLTDKNGKHRIVHGWGDNRDYFVGSFNDYDNKSRISLTAHAYSVISGLTEKFPEITKDVASNIMSLDSKYGLLTFDEPFSEYAPEVGRISTITVGTYENSCAYVHAGTFGAMALFMSGHPKNAWDALEKAMVISHDNVTLSTFVMPNSYCKDEVYGFDGESMGDWYTGSGTVLLKNIVKYAFGIEPDMKGIKIAPAGYFPSEKAEISLKIKGKNFKVRYENIGLEKRVITFNGEELPLLYDDMRGCFYAWISKENLTDNNIISVTD